MGVFKFFDKLEDKVRGFLSHYPIFYGFFAGVGVVLFWRGVWHSADAIAAYFFDWQSLSPTINYANLLDGLLSIAIGSGLLLVTGLFVSTFIGNEVIISGLRGEKRLAEKTEAEIRTETGALYDIKRDLKKLQSRIDRLEKSSSKT